jgi:hypothetical protein
MQITTRCLMTTLCSQYLLCTSVCRLLGMCVLRLQNCPHLQYTGWHSVSTKSPSPKVTLNSAVGTSATSYSAHRAILQEFGSVLGRKRPAQLGAAQRTSFLQSKENEGFYVHTQSTKEMQVVAQSTCKTAALIAISISAACSGPLILLLNRSKIKAKHNVRSCLRVVIEP